MSALHWREKAAHRALRDTPRTRRAQRVRVVSRRERDAMEETLALALVTLAPIVGGLIAYFTF